MSRSVTRMTIDDAEHIPPEERQAIIDAYPEHERDARIKGIPALGSGRVYPVAESLLSVQPFAVPSHWYQIGGLDIGWEHPTAAARIAHDRDNDVLYVIDAYRRKEATPLEHSVRLQTWRMGHTTIPFAWPSDALQRGKRDGQTIRKDYVRHGINMLPTHAKHPDGGVSVEAGVIRILERMQTGGFKVFAHLEEWWEEFRLYHRKNGVITDVRDDLMDATRYAEMMLAYAQPVFDEEEEDEWVGQRTAAGY